ncbi:MAG: flagellar protein FlgN [Proteobacteria bacterium]|nr:MAG: flagellar protein FlgN [Pseudomonadota bacterium]
MKATTHDKLVRLYDLILKERDYAKNFDTASLEAVTREKEDLLYQLAIVKRLDPDDRRLAEQIKRENIRNAYIYKSVLGVIKETMEFFGKRSVTSTYAADAVTVPSQVNGRLLSGKI